MTSKRAVLIAGPTASGKSGLAIALAKKRNGVVINSDSMQVYAILREITARPDLIEMDGIEHLLFGHIDPNEAYSVARWLDDVEEAIYQVWAVGKLPILVGGTGLYFKSALEGLSQIPLIDLDIRRDIRDRSLTDLETVYGELERLDPKGALKLERKDTQRIVRALEVVKSTGRTLAEWQGLPKKAPLLEGVCLEKIVLTPERSLLHERIATRFHQMVKRGALEEVRALLDLNLNSEMPAMRAIGVSQLADVLISGTDLNEAIELSIIATRQYAKRQSTWFRHQFDTDWKIVTSAEAFLSNQ